MVNLSDLMGMAIAVVLAGSGVPAYAYEETTVENPGTVSGAVTLRGGAPASEELKVTKDKRVCAKTPKYDQSLLVADGKVANAVVRITDIKKGKPLVKDKVVLDQKGCEYQPHVLTVTTGAPVVVLNPDRIFHNVHTYSEKNAPINKAMPKFKKKLTVRFKESEAISVKCDAHGWMSAWLFVTDNPYYSVTDELGRFTVADVPPGKYTLEVWHETLGKQTKPITVEPNGQVKVDFAMSR